MPSLDWNLGREQEISGFESINTEIKLHDGIRAIGKPFQTLTKEGLPGQLLLAGGEVILTGKVTTKQGVEYAETTYGYFIRRDVLRNTVSILPGEEKVTTKETTAFVRNNLSWDGQKIPAGTKVVFTGDLVAINGLRYGEISDGAYVYLSDTTAQQKDTRWEDYKKIDDQKIQEKTTIQSEAKELREEIKAQLPTISRAYEEPDLVGIVRELGKDAPFCDESGNAIETLPTKSRVTLTGNARDINGVKFVQIGNGKYMKAEELREPVEARVDREIKEAQEISLESIITIPLNELPRLAAVKLFVKFFGDGPGTRYWLAKDAGQGIGFLREMALALHEWKGKFGREDAQFKTTFQIEYRSYDDVLAVGKQLVEGEGFAVGDPYALNSAQQDLVAHIGHISKRSGEDMWDQDLIGQLCNPSITGQTLVRLMHEKIQAGISAIGHEVVRITNEPFANNFKV